MARSPRSLESVDDAAGIDEAGRGPLAGPVVVAAVWLHQGADLPGLNDSKKLGAVAREALAPQIRAQSRWAVVEVGEDEIDELNILGATMVGMERAFARLEEKPLKVLVDGNRVPKGLVGLAEAVVGGDARFACVAAASVLAKTTRDAIMAAWAREYPQYGFDVHFGYPTPEHLEALRRHGPCPIHRRSFKPVQLCEQPCLITVE